MPRRYAFTVGDPAAGPLPILRGRDAAAAIRAAVGPHASRCFPAEVLRVAIADYAFGYEVLTPYGTARCRVRAVYIGG